MFLKLFVSCAFIIRLRLELGLGFMEFFSRVGLGLGLSSGLLSLHMHAHPTCRVIKGSLLIVHMTYNLNTKRSFVLKQTCKKSRAAVKCVR